MPAAASLPGQLRAEMQRGSRAAPERAAVRAQSLAGTVSGAVQKQRAWGSSFSSPLPLRPPSPPSPSLETAAGKQQSLSTTPGPSASPQAGCYPLLPSPVSCSSGDTECERAPRLAAGGAHSIATPPKGVTQRRLWICPLQNYAGLGFNSWQAGAPPHPPSTFPSNLY